MTLRTALIAIAAVLMLTSGAETQGNNSPEARLRAAMDKETVDGDLKAAIDGYKRVISQRGASRQVVAQALLRLGMAYEKQGDAQARKSYERLVGEFGDQPAVVQQARARLAATLSGTAATTMRLVCWADCDGDLSPDGRFLSRRTGDGGRAVRELSSAGTSRQIVPAPTSGRVFSLVISPDGRRVAYEHTGTGIVMVQGDGSGRRTVFPHRQPGFQSPAPLAWSPDGSRLLIVSWSGERPTDPGRFSWLNVVDGSIQQTLAPVHPYFLEARVSPDGKFVAFNAFERPETPLRTDVFVMASDGSGEMRVSDKAALNMPVGWSPDGRYLFYAQNREDAPLLWKVPMVGGKIQGVAVAVSVPHRGQVDSYLGIVAGTLYYRVTAATTSDIYTASIDPVSGRVTSPPAAIPTTRNGSNVSPRWSPDSRRLLYQSAGPNTTRGLPRELRMISLDDGKDQRVAEKVTYGGDGPCWSPDGGSILVNTVTGGPGAEREEPARVDLATGEFRILFPGTPSFRMRNCSESLMAAFQSGAIKVRNIQSGTEAEVYRPGRNAPGYGVPRLSHDGRSIIFLESVDETTSALMSVPSAGGPARVLARVKAPAAFQPLLGFTWSADDRFVYFLRRPNPNAPHELFRVPAAGGAEERMGLEGADIRDLDIAPDGRGIAFSMGPVGRQEIWAMDNFLPSGN